jgi:soluble lytic murein transglycosylase-like protein
MTAAAALTVGVLASAPVLPSAHADTAAQADAKAQAILTKVHALQAQVKSAEAKYSRAFGAVADSVHYAISADRSSAASASQAASARAALVARVRGLYESGGQLAAEAALLTNGNLSAVSDRTVFAHRAVAVEVANVHAASVASAHAASAARLAVRREHRKIATARTVGAAAARVQRLLLKQQLLLKQADKHLAAVQAAEAALAAQTASFSSITSSAIAALHILPPSSEYLALYKAAAPTCPGLSWTVLAAIGQVESGHGRSTGSSSAGATGPMQFMPGTFAAYAVDGDHDGSASISDPADAIYTAAHYLCANGAAHGPGALAGAILHYNHAVWYEQMVMKLAGMYASQYG